MGYQGVRKEDILKQGRTPFVSPSLFSGPLRITVVVQELIWHDMRYHDILNANIFKTYRRLQFAGRSDFAPIEDDEPSGLPVKTLEDAFKWPTHLVDTFRVLFGHDCVDRLAANLSGAVWSSQYSI